MNAEVFAEWLRLQDHHIVRTPSSYWHDRGPRVYQAFPYHWLIEPPEEDLRDFLCANRAIGLRYSTSPKAHLGYLSYHVVCAKSSYGIEDLGQWARKNVRRGLKNCTVEPISFGRLADEGWELQCDTLDRQGRCLRLGREAWQRRCRAAADLPGFEAWGAVVSKRLGASLITFRMDDCCYMLYQQCHRDYLRAHVNNALSFTVTQAIIARPHIRSILYGLHSLDAPPSVDEFKFRMGYSAKPVRQRVVFHPQIAPLIGAPTHAIAKWLKKMWPGVVNISKVEGLIRFCLEGRRPLQEQLVPPPLVETDFCFVPAVPSIQLNLKERP